MTSVIRTLAKEGKDWENEVYLLGSGDGAWWLSQVHIRLGQVHIRLSQVHIQLLISA